MVGKVDPAWARILTRRVEGETASEMRRHSEEKCLGLLAIYLMSRRSQLIDSLVDLLVDIVHRIGTRSKRKVISKIAADIEKVHGKERLLVDIATAAMMALNGKVSDVIFPIAGAAKLKCSDSNGNAGILRQSLPPDAAVFVVRPKVPHE